MRQYAGETGFVAYAQAIRGWLHREAYRLCGDWHDAEDLTQMTLFALYRRWDHLSDQDQLWSYARLTLLHSFLGERRRLRWSHEIRVAEPPDRSNVVKAVDIDKRVTLLMALKRLGPRQCAVITLRFYGDYSVEQTAAVLGCSIGTVTSQTHRALGTLRRMLAIPCP